MSANTRTNAKRGAGRGERGQTNIDLLVGVFVFLVAVGVALATASAMTDSLVDDPASPLAADRTAELLAEGMFAPPGASESLEASCVVGFFNESMGTGTCAVAYNESESDLGARLGLPTRYAVNVTVHRPVTGDPGSEVLCTDGGSAGACPGTTRLAAGSAPPDSAPRIRSRRGAVLDGRDVIIEVVLW